MGLGGRRLGDRNKFLKNGMALGKYVTVSNPGKMPQQER